jgi:hypothetical protein
MIKTMPAGVQGPVASSHVYRTRSVTRTGLAVAAFLVLLAVGESLRAINDGVAIPAIPVMLLIAAPGILFNARAGLTGVVVQNDSVRIVNLRNTRCLRWDEIERFSVGQLGLRPRTGIVELRDGRRIGIWSIQGPNPTTRPNNRSAERLIDQLNQELAEHRAP